MRQFIVSILSIALQSIVTYYYFNYFGLTWKSVITFFIGVQYIKAFIEWNDKHKN